jgi:hypothetical protein
MNANLEADLAEDPEAVRVSLRVSLLRLALSLRHDGGPFRQEIADDIAELRRLTGRPSKRPSPPGSPLNAN